MIHLCAPRDRNVVFLDSISITSQLESDCLISRTLRRSLRRNNLTASRSLRALSDSCHEA